MIEQVRNYNLRIPGPTPCPPGVLLAYSQQVVDHRGDEFKSLLWEVSERLSVFMQTEDFPLILTGSGTSGMDALIGNTLSGGDMVVSLSTGSFGKRFAEMATNAGARVEMIESENGQGVDLNQFREHLLKNPGVKAALFTHNETSTGVTNDLYGFAEIAEEFGVLKLVDCVSSLGCLDVPIDELNLDGVVTASQKGWMCPPGLAMVHFGRRAREARAKLDKVPSTYLDLAKAYTFFDEKSETPFTPAVNAVFALDVALGMMEKEGQDEIIERHHYLAKDFRKGVQELGLELFADPMCVSDTVTAIRTPFSRNRLWRNASQIVAKMKEQRVIIASGQEGLRELIVRVGHMGWVNQRDMDETLYALKKSIQ